MSKILNTVKLVAACVFAALSLASTDTLAYTSSCPDNGSGPLNGCSLPGVVDGSYPFFDTVVSVSYNEKKDGAFDIKTNALKGSVGNWLALGDTTSYLIEKPKYSLKATVDGGIATGKLNIGGKIDGQKFKVTADLDGQWNSSIDGTLWGFNTTNIVCSDLINSLTGGCTTDEVVYLNLLEAIGPETGFNKISTAGRALTSVPVPAAAWLFGSGLIGLAGIARRRWSA